MHETEITLEQLLESRDKRAEFQTILLNGYGTPLVSFTVNMPGKVKKNHRSARVFEAGVEAIRETLAGYIVYYKLLDNLTGPEGYFAVDMAVDELKGGNDPFELPKRPVNREKRLKILDKISGEL